MKNENDSVVLLLVLVNFSIFFSLALLKLVSNRERVKERERAQLRNTYKNAHTIEALNLI